MKMLLPALLALTILYSSQGPTLPVSNAPSDVNGLIYVDGTKYKTIAAADAACGSKPCDIPYSNAAGTEIVGPLFIGPNHVLIFVQGGTYTVSEAITLNQGSVITSWAATGEAFANEGNPVVIKEAPGSNLSPLIRMQGGQATISNLVVDCNKSQNPTAGTCVLMTYSKPRSNVWFMSLKDVTVQNGKGDCVEVISSFSERTPPYYFAEAAGANFHHANMVGCDLDGLYVANTSDVYASDHTSFESNGLGSNGISPPYTTVDVSGNSLTWKSGAQWSTDRSLLGRDISVNDCRLKITSVPTATTMTVSSVNGYVGSQSCTIVSQLGASLRMGSGVELYNTDSVRLQGGDVGGNMIDGIKITGNGVIHSPRSISNFFTGNQFGNNVENDIEIQGWDPPNNDHAATNQIVIGNFFIGGGPLRDASKWPSIYIQDSGSNSILSNSFLSNFRNRYTYGVQVHETAASRELQDAVLGNQFAVPASPWGQFAQGSFYSDTAVLTNFSANKETGSNDMLLTSPYLRNNDFFKASDAQDKLHSIFGLGKDDTLYFYGHPLRNSILFQPKPGNSRLTVSDSNVAINGVPFISPSYATADNCHSTELSATCGSAAAGSVVIQTGSSSVVIRTRAVTAASQILATFDSSIGARMSVTCNTAAQAPYISTRIPGQSFVISVPEQVVTHPACFNYWIIN